MGPPDRIQVPKDLLDHHGLMPIGQPRADPWIDPDGDVRADRGSACDKRFESRVGHASFDAPNMRAVDSGRAGHLGDARAGIDSRTHEVVGDLPLDSPEPGINDPLDRPRSLRPPSHDRIPAEGGLRGVVQTPGTETGRQQIGLQDWQRFSLRAAGDWQTSDRPRRLAALRLAGCRGLANIRSASTGPITGASAQSCSLPVTLDAIGQRSVRTRSSNPSRSGRAG